MLSFGSNEFTIIIGVRIYGDIVKLGTNKFVVFAIQSKIMLIYDQVQLNSEAAYSTVKLTL